jgi:polysaccharide deacetylase family protein (PEP-CTERM system associated)
VSVAKTLITNALTIDVEDYFQLNAFSDVIRYEDWDTFKPTVEKNTYKILDLLDSVEVNQGSQFTVHSSQLIAQSSVTSENGETKIQSWKSSKSCRTSDSPKATFFVLGWITERFPHIVKEIHARGHEVACHGYSHQLIFNQTQEEFLDDVKRAKNLLEDIIGEKVVGYRAPTYSITEKTFWALGILHDLGFKYDSSIFPIKHDVYGWPGSPRFPYVISFNNGKSTLPDISRNINYDLKSYNENSRSIIEVPMATVRMFNKNVPAAGGGYFRLFPYFLTKHLLRGINNKEKKPFVFYLHPWEIDQDIPRTENARAFSRFRTYVNLDKTITRFSRLLSDFKFISLSDLLFRN